MAKMGKARLVPLAACLDASDAGIAGEPKVKTFLLALARLDCLANIRNVKHFLLALARLACLARTDTGVSKIPFFP